MLTAIEDTPFSERDRQKSERTLQHLVQGRAVKKIATRGLPPLAEMPTLAMAGLPAIPPGPGPGVCPRRCGSPDSPPSVWERSARCG